MCRSGECGEESNRFDYKKWLVISGVMPTKVSCKSIAYDSIQEDTLVSLAVFYYRSLSTSNVKLSFSH